MSLFKELRDIDSEAEDLSMDLDSDWIRDDSTENWLESISKVLEDDYYANYYKNMYKNGRIKLFTLNKDRTLESSLRTKFLVAVYKLLYKRDTVISREFRQFLNPSSYNSDFSWIVGGGLFKYWSIYLNPIGDKLVVSMNIDHDNITETIKNSTNEEIINIIYHFKDIDHNKENHKLIYKSLAAIVFTKVETDLLEKYNELCAIFRVNK